MTQKTSARYSPEVRARAVRMVLEHRGDYASQWSAIVSIASKIGCTGETLRKWLRQAEREQNIGMLKSGIMQLLRFMEGKKA